MARLRLVLLALTVIAAACAGDSAGETTTTAAGPGTTTSAAGDGGGTATISIVDLAFSGPDEVAAGTTLTIANNDGVSHTFTADDGSFDSGTIAAGATAEVTLDEPGEFAYFCNFHPQMEGTITVTG